tara:strand:- start:4159 stop:4851 length:693 start_codon:yes stop_codon:yes gene_type:complete
MSGTQKTIRLSTPQVEEEVVTARRGLPANGRFVCADRFVYTHYPTNWEYDDEHGFVPRLNKVMAKPGVNGVGADRKLNRSLAWVSEQGGTFIDPKDTRLGEYQNYVRYYETESGQKHYCDFSDEATVLPNGKVLWNKSESAKAFRKFRAAIRDSGIIEPMHEEVYVALKVKAERRANSLHGRADRNPHLLKKAQAAEARLEAMDQEFEKIINQMAKATPKGNVDTFVMED